MNLRFELMPLCKYDEELSKPEARIKRLLKCSDSVLMNEPTNRPTDSNFLTYLSTAEMNSLGCVEWSSIYYKKRQFFISNGKSAQFKFSAGMMQTTARAYGNNLRELLDRDLESFGRGETATTRPGKSSWQGRWFPLHYRIDLSVFQAALLDWKLHFYPTPVPNFPPRINDRINGYPREKWLRPWVAVYRYCHRLIAFGGLTLLPSGYGKKRKIYRIMVQNDNSRATQYLINVTGIRDMLDNIFTSSSIRQALCLSNRKRADSFYNGGFRYRRWEIRRHPREKSFYLAWGMAKDCIRAKGKQIYDT